MKIFKKPFLTIGAVFVLVLSIGLFLFYFYFSASFLTVESVTVGPKWVNQAQFAGMFVAQEENIYRKHGLSVSFKEFDFETDQMNDLLSGTTDFAIVSAEEFLIAASKGEAVQAVAAIYQLSPYAVATLKENSIDSPVDFRGEILGNKGGKTEEKLFYLLLLESVGLTADDVTLKDLGFEKREIDDLVDGDVAAVGLYRTDQLYFFEQEGIDYNVIYPEHFGVNVYNDVLITTTDMITSHPERVRSFVRATIEGWDEALADTDKAVAHTMKYVTNDAYNDVAYERFILENSIPLIHPNQNQSIGAMNYYQWDKLYTTLREKKFIINDLDVAKIFTTEFIP